VERPVVWDAAGPFTHTGVATVAGTADAADGRTLPATVRVQVTAGTADNVADDSASYRANVQGRRQEVTATAADPCATATVEQAEKRTGTAVITVRSEDGSQAKT
jgi:hypothetical protein